MVDAPHWRCPRCRRIHGKRYEIAPIEMTRGGRVFGPTHHDDVRCQCGELVRGYMIVGGQYDDYTIQLADGMPGMGLIAGGIIGIIVSIVFDRGLPIFLLIAAAGMAVGAALRTVELRKHLGVWRIV